MIERTDTRLGGARGPAVAPRFRARVAGFAIVAVSLLGVGPCGMIAGSALSGAVHDTPIADWSFVNDLGTCAVEVRPADPHSVTVNCMAEAGRLYVSCSSCEGKTWSGLALANSSGRIRAGDRIYPVRIRRVEDAAELDRVWRARTEKLGGDTEPRAAGWWTFELRSRAP